MEQHWHIGPAYVTLDGQPMKLSLTEAALPTWTASLNSDLRGRAPLWLRLKHKGDGFVYLNDHCLGRCYEKGPQTEYYLPECWLNSTGKNTVSVKLVPTAGAEVTEMAITAPAVDGRGTDVLGY